MKRTHPAIRFITVLFLCSVLLASCDFLGDTGTSAFKVYDTIPLGGTTDASPGTVVSITFSAELDKHSATTDTIILTDSNGRAVPGEVSAYGVAASYAPTDLLADLTTYRVTITTQLKDIHGRSLPENYTFSFTTGSRTSAKLSEEEADYPSSARKDPAF